MEFKSSLMVWTDPVFRFSKVRETREMQQPALEVPLGTLPHFVRWMGAHRALTPQWFMH